MAAHLTGGCGCGAVRFEISEPFASASYCHCTRCQRRTGTAASANARAAPGSFQVVAGEEHLRSWAPEGGAEKLPDGMRPSWRRLLSTLTSTSESG